MAKDTAKTVEEPKAGKEQPVVEKAKVMSRGDIVARRSGHQKEHVRYRG